MKKVDVNVDVGEGFPFDDDLLKLATSANICCGEHAGSWDLTLETIEICRRLGVRIGMHPGFPDRETMGRRNPASDYEMLWLLSLRDQGRRFMDVVEAAYVKPHGTFFNALIPSVPRVMSEGLFGGVRGVLGGICTSHFLAAMLFADSDGAEIILNSGGKVIREGFAERGYGKDGMLIPRDHPGALLTNADEIAAQVLRLAPKCDSLCIHGDSVGCVETLELVVKTLKDAGYEVAF